MREFEKFQRAGSILSDCCEWVRGKADHVIDDRCLVKVIVRATYILETGFYLLKNA